MLSSTTGKSTMPTPTKRSSEGSPQLPSPGPFSRMVAFGFAAVAAVCHREPAPDYKTVRGTVQRADQALTALRAASQGLDEANAAAARALAGLPEELTK